MASEIAILPPKEIALLSQENRSDNGLIVYLHGFNPVGEGYRMPKLIDYLIRQVPNANYCSSIAPMYETYSHTFVEIADLLMRQYGQKISAFRRRYAVCHSMGGVIARQMNLLGANFDAVVTLNTPHDGTANWVNGLSSIFKTRGGLSIASGSPDLNDLNNCDQAFHARYHFVGVSYHGKAPLSPLFPCANDNDTVVERPSQLAENLGSHIHRYPINLDFGDKFAPEFIGSECPHNSLFSFPCGDNPNAEGDTTPLSYALRKAIQI